jgi:hypothetical protein
MKRLIPVLFFIILFTGSCEKERCWKCTTFIEFDYIHNPALSSIDSEKETLCGQTESEIREYEDRNTYSHECRTGIPAYHYDFKSSCYCN